jgi:catalase-peroxidase
VPDAHDPSKQAPPVMTTADLSLRFDPIYEPISRRFHKDPAAIRRRVRPRLVQAHAPRHGPRSRYLGPEVPTEALIWQDPLPSVAPPTIDAADVVSLKALIAASGLTIAELVATAWGSASTFRGSDKRGGANGARIRLAPQKDWEVNQPVRLARVLQTLERVQSDFNGQAGGKKVSLADLIVLGGNVGVEQAAKKAGYAVEVPFSPGRVDATQEQTDVASFAPLEPVMDGFRNFRAAGCDVPSEVALVDRAQLLTLTAPELTVLIGGLRVLNVGSTAHGVFTHRPGTLSQDFFVNLLDMRTTWTSTSEGAEHFEGRDRTTGALMWTATRADLVFGSNSQLRALAEVWACQGAEAKFVADFVAAWTKVMNLVHGKAPCRQRRLAVKRGFSLLSPGSKYPPASARLRG